MECAVMHDLREYEARQHEEDARYDFVEVRAEQMAREDVTGHALMELVSAIPIEQWNEMAAAIRDDESADAGLTLERAAIAALLPAARRRAERKVRQDHRGRFYMDGDGL